MREDESIGLLQEGRTFHPVYAIRHSFSTAGFPGNAGTSTGFTGVNPLTSRVLSPSCPICHLPKERILLETHATMAFPDGYPIPVKSLTQRALTAAMVPLKNWPTVALPTSRYGWAKEGRTVTARKQVVQRNRRISIRRTSRPVLVIPRE